MQNILWFLTFQVLLNFSISRLSFDDDSDGKVEILKFEHFKFHTNKICVVLFYSKSTQNE